MSKGLLRKKNSSKHSCRKKLPETRVHKAKMGQRCSEIQFVVELSARRRHVAIADCCF